MVAVVLVVLAALALAGYAYGRSRGLIAGPSASPSPTPSATPGTSLTLPVRFGEYTRDDTTQVESPVRPDNDLATATAYYARNGQRSVLVIGATPVYDLEAFLLSLGLSGVTAVGDGACGTYTGVTLCAVLADRIAVGTVALAGQGRADLVEIAQRARTAF